MFILLLHAIYNIYIYLILTLNDLQGCLYFLTNLSKLFQTNTSTLNDAKPKIKAIYHTAPQI